MIWTAPRTPLRFPAWRWAALLGFALLAPAALPAGGGEHRLPQPRRRESRREPLVVGDRSSLQTSPQRQAPVLARLEPGTPLRVLQEWMGADGQGWWQVEIPHRSAQPSRGWLSH